jgi:hypothetical protein
MKSTRVMKATTRFYVIRVILVIVPFASGLALAPLASNAAPNAAPAGSGSRSPVLKPPVAAAAPAGWAIPRLGPPGRQWDDGRSGLGGVQILVEPDAGERGPASKTRTRFGVVKIGANPRASLASMPFPTTDPGCS